MRRQASAGDPRRRLRTVLALFGLASGATGLLGCPLTALESETTEVAEATRPAPDFTLNQLGGGQVSLSELRGKTVVLDFWATWCPPCEFQVPELNRFYDAHRSDSDVVVYGVSVDFDGADVVEAWTTEKAVRYPILLDGESLARELGALGFPTLYVIGPDGHVRESHIGLIETETLEQAVATQRQRPAAL
ncbi:MAG: redoxin domain-containing protein [Deltaproteobacteria bacterium]|jgi:peroxiredoxin|nr:redoxin domain-containing protein [Deltaproteobacteria bacterium]